MSESLDTKALEMAELQKGCSEKILSTNRFIVSTLIILFVLAIVVEQELREHRREEQLLSKRVLDTTGKLRESKKELTETYAKLKKFLRSEAYETTLRPYDSGSAVKLFTVTSYTCRLNSLCAPLEHLPKPIVSVKEPDDLEKLQSGETELKEELDKLEGGRDKIDGKNRKLQIEQLQLFDKGVGLYRDYARVYRDYSNSARRLLATREERNKLNSSKRSIPTPFGSFDVQPRLALFALAFATVFSYFAFLSSVYRIRALAKIYCSGHTGGKAITGSDPAPFWLYSTEPELSQALTWRTNPWLTTLLSLALHAGWILLAAWLAWECWWRWRSVDSLLFEYRSFWVYALAACLVLATLLAVWQFIPGRLRQALRIVGGVGDRVSALAKRRAFLRGAIASAGVVALGGGVFYWLSRQSNQKIAKRCGLRSSDFNISSSNWVVVNSRTRVVHHEDICSAHLPAEKNRVALAQVGGDLCLHASYQGRILEDLVKYELPIQAPASVEGKNAKVKLSPAERQARHKKSLSEAERAVPYLVKAIELNPLGYHLYDKLIRVYGRLSRYQDIAQLLDGAQQSVARETAELKQQSPPTPVAVRRLKHLARAQKEFESRVAAVASRRKYAEAMRKLRTG